MGARRTSGVEHDDDRRRKTEANRTRRVAQTHLTPTLETAITSAIREGATLGAAILAVRDATWRDSSVWLNTSSVYRWLHNARAGFGTSAEERFLRAVVEAETERGPATRSRAGALADAARIVDLERRVQTLEEHVAALAAVAPAGFGHA